MNVTIFFIFALNGKEKGHYEKFKSESNEHMEKKKCELGWEKFWWR